MPSPGAGPHELALPAAPNISGHQFVCEDFRWPAFSPASVPAPPLHLVPHTHPLAGQNPCHPALPAPPQGRGCRAQQKGSASALALLPPASCETSAGPCPSPARGPLIWKTWMWRGGGQLRQAPAVTWGSNPSGAAHPLYESRAPLPALGLSCLVCKMR